MKHERPTMDEELYRNLGWGRRRSLRRHFGYPGQMHFEEGLPPQACVIIDMSETGAQLEVPPDVAVPGEFVLLIGGNSHVQRLCKLVWRTGKRIGVEFRVAVKPPTRSVDQPLGAGRAAKVRAP
jgi:PilZ domain-containing protein